ncbi:MAG: AAA family ATPase [Rothia mucilaginosa]|jgi:ATP/GTP binding protein|nr:AAA family ATPase [Rothia mucilaginosa]
MVDATKVSKVKIDTGYAGWKEYPFFTRVNKEGLIIDDAQVSIVLGGNGSGKSTISRALNGNNKGVKFFDKDGNLLGGDCLNVHVFNEDYVIENFRTYKPDYLEPVILLGKSGNLVDKIEEVEKKIAELEKRRQGIKDAVFSRLPDEIESNLDIKIGEFAIRDYINSCIANELVGLDDSYNYDIEDLFDSLLDGNGDIDLNMCLRWINLGCNEAREDIYHDMYYEDLDEDGNSVWVENKDWYLSDRSLEYFDKELKDLGGQIGGWIYQIHQDMDEKTNYISYIDLLRDDWHSYCYTLMASFYKFYPAVYSKFDDGFSENSERSMYQSLTSDVVKLQEKVDDLRKKLEHENKRNSSEEVIKYMNRWLRLVFGENLISIEANSQLGYNLKNLKGQVIPPGRLSLGEQNILALCYFFVAKVSGGRLGDYGNSNQIILLDDPVSSFDYNNKYGVMQVLNHIAGLVSGDKSESKMLIMTHDPVTARELSNAIKHRAGGDKVKCCRIVDSQNVYLEPVKLDGLDEYRGILHKMFEVATQEGKGIDLISPNEVRRVWEAFLRFELGESEISSRNALDRVSCFYDDQSAEYKFLESFISYVYINQDSHSSDQMLFDNFDLIPILGRREFEKHIRQIVLFMRLVAPSHIPSRLAKSINQIAGYRKALDDIYKANVLGQPKG